MPNFDRDHLRMPPEGPLEDRVKYRRVLQGVMDYSQHAKGTSESGLGMAPRAVGGYPVNPHMSLAERTENSAKNSQLQGELAASIELALQDISFVLEDTTEVEIPNGGGGVDRIVSVPAYDRKEKAFDLCRWTTHDVNGAIQDERMTMWPKDALPAFLDRITSRHDG